MRKDEVIIKVIRRTKNGFKCSLGDTAELREANPKTSVEIRNFDSITTNEGVKVVIKFLFKISSADFTVHVGVPLSSELKRATITLYNWDAVCSIR